MDKWWSVKRQEYVSYEEYMKDWFSENNKSTQDPVVNRVIDKFIDRSNRGMVKYGLSMESNKAPVLDWINHAQEELMDGILYLEKLKTSLVGCAGKDYWGVNSGTNK